VKPISFIIITYNRPEDTLQLLRNIEQFDQASELLEEVVLLNNASTSDYSAVEAFVKTNTLPILYIASKENLGVARGRNFAIQKSTAPILIMLDDDAVLQNKDCLVQLVQEFNTRNTERPKAIVSFKVLYYETLQMQKNALPHKQFNTFKDKPFFETYFYAGGAHAIRRNVLNEVGNYPEDFFYGMEEYDLSYRILDEGYSIVYSNKIVMLHKESPLGRKPKAEKLMMMWVNKSKVAWRYLPKKYFYSTAVLWSIYYLLKSGGDLKKYVAGWRKIVQIPRVTQRRTIKNETLRYLQAIHARLWY
jgi:GT2 family glycosyltransferase